MIEMPMRRRDEESDWHDLVPGTCDKCGCTYYRAKDDPGIVWDPGSAWADECRDRECTCHVSPVVGARRSGEPL